MSSFSTNNQSTVTSGASKTSQLAGVKRRVNSSAINDAVKMSKQRNLMTALMQETNGSQIWNTSAANNFVNTKTMEVNADPTALTNDEILFKMRAGDKYMHVNTTEFLIEVKLQRKEGGVWKDLTGNESVIVLPNAIMNLLRENLEVKIVHPGEAEDTTVINVKQDNVRYITRNEIQRTYDKLYCEKELKEPMQVVKELTYPFEFDISSSAEYRPGKPLAAYGKRPRNADITLAADSIQKICEGFAKELQTSKKFAIKSTILDPVFDVAIIPPHHGLNVSMKLGREEDHAKYIEDYTKLAASTTDQLPYRFKLQKGGAHKVKCRYDTSSLTTSALARYNDQFENNKTVDVSTFMVYKVIHRNVEQNATEYLDFKFPNTSNMPSVAHMQMMDREDFNHTDVRANYFSNVFLNNVKQIKFNSANDLNPTYLDGVNQIDLQEDIDKEGAYKSQRRYMFGHKNVNMSDLMPVYKILNGASTEMYANEGESKTQFMTMESGRHLTPFVLEMDPSHGKYGPDQKQTNMANTEVSMNFIFRQALTRASVILLTCAYKGKYVQKRLTNGTLAMYFQNVDIAANLL